MLVSSSRCHYSESCSTELIFLKIGFLLLMLHYPSVNGKGSSNKDTSGEPPFPHCIQIFRAFHQLCALDSNSVLATYRCESGGYGDRQNFTPYGMGKLTDSFCVCSMGCSHHLLLPFVLALQSDGIVKQTTLYTTKIISWLKTVNNVNLCVLILIYIYATHSSDSTHH